MSDPYVYKMPGTEIPHVPWATCIRCDGRENLIEGEGVAACRHCIMSLGEIAGDPHKATGRVLEALQQHHGHSVILARTKEKPSRLVWDWIEP